MNNAGLMKWRTVRTGLSRLGCPSDVAEAILGHSKKGIEGTYNLHGYEFGDGIVATLFILFCLNA